MSVPVAVSVVKVRDNQSLVEWVDDKNFTHRAWFPVSEVKDNKVENVSQGLDYGDDFGELIEKLPSKHDIVQALHNQGLWSVSDLAINPSKVQFALAAAYGPVVNQLLVPSKEE